MFSSSYPFLSAWLRELADLGMGQAEVTPVETKTSVIRPRALASTIIVSLVDNVRV